MKGVSNIICTIASAVVALAVGAIGMWLCYDSRGLYWMLGYFALFIAFYPISVTLHEAGHKLFGKLAGMDVETGRSSAFKTVACCFVRPLKSTHMKGRFIATASGGIAVNAAFAVAGLALFAGNDVCILFTFIAPASVYLFIINAVPLEYRDGKTDGLFIHEAVKGESSFQVLARVLEIQGMVSEGSSLADIDEDMLFSVPQIREDDISFILLVSLRADYYKEKGDRNNYEKWSARLESLKKYLPADGVSDDEA